LLRIGNLQIVGFVIQNVRGYAMDTVAGYAKVSAKTSGKSYEILKFTLEMWGEKHAKQVFSGSSHSAKPADVRRQGATAQ
jgi:hypothetical protein